MKNLILLSVFILFFSCASKKVVTQTDSIKKVDIQNAIADTKSSQTDTKKTVVDESQTDDETVVKTTNYDTSKPSDPATGKPPVLNETTTTRKKHKKADVKTKVDTAKKAEATHADNGKTNEQSNEKTKIKEAKTSDVKYWYEIVLVIGLCVLGFVIYKKINWFKNIFNRIRTLFGF